MTARKKTRYGHTGNSKNWQVHYRDNVAERAEKKEFGCNGVDDWTISPTVRLTQADRMADRLERMGCEYKMVNINLEVTV